VQRSAPAAAPKRQASSSRGNSRRPRQQ
jgi:hypothetical protein